MAVFTTPRNGRAPRRARANGASTPTPHAPRPVVNPVSSPADTPRTLTASALKIDTSNTQIMSRLRNAAQLDRQWQRRAWDGYSSVGEIHYGFNLVANLVSRIRFYPAATITPNTTPAYVDDVDDLTPGLATATQMAFDRLSKNGSLAEIARILTLNFSIPGEGYLVQTPASVYPQATPEFWTIRSIDEVLPTEDGVRILTTPPNAPANYSASGLISSQTFTDANSTLLPKSAFVARIWRRHPRWASLADSSLSAVLDPIDELMLINQTFRATARSRLNSGLLFVPDGLSASTPLPTAPFEPPPIPNPLPTDPDDPHPAHPIALPPPSPPQPIPENATQPPDADAFEEALLEGMMTPIQDPSGASAVVPILVRGPADLGDKIRLINFERTFDPSLVQRADRVLERILQGIDLPKDVVSGLSNVRYSNAVIIEESLFRAHIEPLILLIVDALSEVYLRPAVVAAGFTPQQAQRIRFWYDATSVVARPNRATDAVATYDRYALSAQALRQASGFNEEDAPSPSEIVLRMLYQKGPITPDLAEALMRNLAPLLLESARQTAAEGSENPLPPEVQDLLGNTTPPIPPEGTPAPQPLPPEQQPGQPAPEAQPIQDINNLLPNPGAPPNATPAPRAANPSGPRPGRPTTNPPDNAAPPGLPPRPRPRT